MSIRKYHLNDISIVPVEEEKNENGVDPSPPTDVTDAMKSATSCWMNNLKKLIHDIAIDGFMRETQKYLCNFQGMKTHPLTFFLICVDLILRGISQVYLCDNPITGLLIAIGVGLSSFSLILHGILGVIGSTLGATIVCRLPYSKINTGLVGYDGALVGCAVYTFFITGHHNYLPIITFFLSAISGILHMSLANILGLAKLPPFTAAFNVTVFCLLLSVSQGNTTIATFRPANENIDPTSGYQDESFAWFITIAIKGVGQFMFADTLVGGILIILGITLQHRRDGFCAVLGAFVGGISARYVFSLPSSSSLAISTGLYGYNAAGTCVVLGGGRFYRDTNSAYVIAIIGAILSVYLQITYESLFVITTYSKSSSVISTDPIPVLVSLPVLTFPFITTAWLMMLTQSAWLTVRSDGSEESENLAPSRTRNTINQVFARVKSIQRTSFRTSSKKITV